MAEEQVGLSISREDLAQLAQVLHIADMRLANERITFLENRIKDLDSDLEEANEEGGAVELKGYKIAELIDRAS